MAGESENGETPEPEAILFCSEVEVSSAEPGDRPRNGAAFDVRPLGDAASTSCPVFVSRDALEAAVRFARTDMEREQGGFLVGGRFVDAAEEFIWIREFLDGRGIRGEATSARFTAETFEDAWNRIAEKSPYGYSPLLLGWVHTHPGLGVFLSEADRFIHERFFDLPFLVALVLDPVREELLLYRWREGDLKTTGFHLVRERSEPMVSE